MLRNIAQFVGLALSLTLLPGAALAQVTPDDDPRRDDGFHLKNVGASVNYFSQAVPPGVNTFDDVFLGSSSAGSASMNLSVRKTGNSGVLNILSYSAYSMRAQRETSKGWNEVLTGGMLRRVRRWSFQASGDAAVMNFNEAMFAGSTMSTLASTSLTFPEFVDAVTGQPGVTATASGGRYETDANAGRRLLGQRTLSYGGQVGLGYARTRRMTVDVSAAMADIRQLLPEDVSEDVTDLHATNVSIGSSVSFDLSRQSSVGFGASVSQSTSEIAENRSRSLTVSGNQTIGRLFVVQGSVGYGATVGENAQGSVIYSGGGGIMTRAHSVIGNYRRSVNSLYSVALGEDSAFFSMATATWNWSPMRAKWAVNASYSHYRDQPARKIFKLPAPTSWIIQGTLNRQLGGHFVVSGNYSVGRTGARRYVQDGVQYKLEQNAFRATIAWSPRVDPVRR